MTNLLAVEFHKVFRSNAISSFFCPGRVNLIGEHLDYNGGMVLPAAISMGTYLLMAPNEDNVFRLRSLNFKDEIDLADVSSFEPLQDYWYNYPLGVIQYFLSRGFAVPAMDCLFYGDIPIGAGLSSSASIEVVTAFATNYILRGVFETIDIVKLSQEVENKFIGVNCGIMDQFAVAFGQKDHALLLNCATLDFKPIPFELGDYILAIINTNKPRKLSESKYNERVQECTEALKCLQQHISIENLCDLNPDKFYEIQDAIPNQTVRKRAMHIIEENERVKRAAKAMMDDNIEFFGQLMFDSHVSLRDLYQVTGQELDAIYDYSKCIPGVLGARMTGAGFGGCAIALIHKHAINEFSEGLKKFYHAKFGYYPDVYTSTISRGVNLSA